MSNIAKIFGALAILAVIFLCAMVAYDLYSGNCFMGDACAGFYK